MKKIKNIAFLCVAVPFFLLIASCTNSKSNITAKQIAHIKENFTPEEITYFYDIVYGPEGIGVNNDKVKKYRRGIKYHIKWENEFELEKNDIIKKVFDTLAILTNLEITPTIDEKEANLKIFFLERDKISIATTESGKKSKKISKNIRGLTTQDIHKTGAIRNGYVIIPTDLPEKTIPHVLLEEITQVLGLSSDSFKYLNSIFYEGESYISQLSKIDKKVVRLLYSQNVDFGLTKKEFYNAFKNLLESPNLKDQYYKFEQFIVQSKFSKEAVGLFCKLAFSSPNEFIKEEHIQKYAHNQIVIKGGNNAIIDTTLSFFKKQILTINFQKLKNEHKETFNLIFTPINLDTTQLSNGWRFVNKIIDYQVFKSGVNYNNKNSSLLNKKIIVRNTLTALGLNYGLDFGNSIYSNLLSYKSTDILSKYDKELFHMFFHPSLKSGMTKSAIYKILNKHYNLYTLVPSYQQYEKLEIYLAEKKLSNKMKPILYSNLLKGGKVVKWDGSIIVKSKNKFVKNDSLFLNTILNKFNSSFKKDILVLDNSLLLDETVGVWINYDYEKIKDSTLNQLIIKEYKEIQSNNIKTLKTKINLNEKEIIARNTWLLVGFFKLLTDFKKSDIKLFYSNVSETSFELTDLGKEALHFYYHPTFHTGMKKEKVLNVLKNQYDLSELENRDKIHISN